MARMAHPPAPRVAPTGGDIDQRLAQVVQMINDLSVRMEAPAFTHITLMDDAGKTWNLYMQSNGQLRTELVTR